MAGDSKKLQPIIVKRIKKGGHAAHGGAWKIAYADFVTAMMAFFLLMWLLGSTSEGDRKGIADYFTSPLKVSLLGGGSGSGDSSHVIKGGGSDLSRSNGQVKQGDVNAPRKTINLQALKDAAKMAEAQRLKEVKEKIEQSFTNSPQLAPYRSQILIDVISEGLRIQIVDTQNRPMFDSGSVLVKDYMRDILREIGKALANSDNRIILAGHTDAAPYSTGERGYSNWELSADRANASRRELIAGGLKEGQVARVVGLAASSLFNRTDPMDPANRRISIIMMNQEAEVKMNQSAESNTKNGTESSQKEINVVPSIIPLVKPKASDLSSPPDRR